ncbi:protein MGARP isoform X3 [Colossoma macropomum]|uniref:protein MGARP isoform X3 n=1 Tax=Colossoma macropomum TaxID=42526 RepID=UPI0018655FF1|nr:protein MGARP isoform X3 [Colossoma macropomum]
MFAVRAAWRRCAVRQALTLRSSLNGAVAPRRLMSSVPGGTGENIVYVVLCGGAFAGAMAYAYKTVASDSTRFSDRVTEIQARPKDDWKPKPWPPKSEDGGKEF